MSLELPAEALPPTSPGPFSIGLPQNLAGRQPRSGAEFVMLMSPWKVASGTGC